MTMRSHLAPFLADLPLDEGAFARAAGLCWRHRSVAFIRPEDVEDPEDRAAVIRAADRLYGPRKGGRGR